MPDSEDEILVSVNKRADELLGRRPEGVPIDLPLELGYECPIHQDHSEDLAWSEYQGFLWCERCNHDYPSPLCVPMESHGPYDWKSMDWFRFGPEAAVEIFLDVVQAAVERAMLNALAKENDGEPTA